MPKPETRVITGEGTVASPGEHLSEGSAIADGDVLRFVAYQAGGVATLLALNGHGLSFFATIGWATLAGNAVSHAVPRRWRETALFLLQRTRTKIGLRR